MSELEASQPLLTAVAKVDRFRTRQLGIDRIFEGVIIALASLSLVVLATIILLLFSDASPAITRYGLNFLTDSVWDPVFEKFGAAPFIFGTLLTSLIGLLIAMPVAVGGAVYLSDYSPSWLSDPLGFLIELLAAIPSIIYGLWGFFVLAPFMRFNVEAFLKQVLSPIPVASALVDGPVIGKDVLVAGVILAIMILPTILSISREVLRTVPQAQREGMLGLGATKWEVTRHVVLPNARAGILAAGLLGLARALGETMAVTMVIGNSSNKISASLFTPGYTIASAIANQFTEADKPIYFSAIVELALVLLLVAGIMNIIARFIIGRATRGPAGARK